MRGYALIAALLMVLAASLAAALAVHCAQTEAQREREAQLLFVGDQYRQALRSYYLQRPAGGAQQYPETLEALLADTRFAHPARHLRRLFVDPMTGRADWVVERSQGRIVGLHSRSEAVPLRHANFSSVDAGFSSAETYAQWTFSAPVAAGTAAPAATAGNPARGTGSNGGTGGSSAPAPSPSD